MIKEPTTSEALTGALVCCGTPVLIGLAIILAAIAFSALVYYLIIKAVLKHLKNQKEIKELLEKDKNQHKSR